MKYLIILFSFVMFTTPAVAQGGSQDAAFDERQNFVVDKWGKCVRTKWMGDEDPCNPTPPPAPVKPAPKPAYVAPAPKVNLEQRTVYFDFDSAGLDDEAIAKLNQLSQIINQSSAIRDVHIVGYTDQFGSDSYNMALSKKRVKAVEAYLDQRSRLDTRVADMRGLGKAPATDCSNVKGRQAKIACMRPQRRVEVEFKFVQRR